MIFSRPALSATLVLLLFASQAIAADWLTYQSYYTHDENNGRRVSQYAPIGPFYVYGPANFVRSGYRHYRSTIQAGGSADNYHMVEEWGRPVEPYEQWRFPYRPYGSPYPDWGPPFAGVQVNGWNGGAWPGGWNGGGPGLGPGIPPGYHGRPGNNYPYYQPTAPAQSIDGYWPTYDRHDRTQYYRQ